MAAPQVVLWLIVFFWHRTMPLSHEPELASSATTDEVDQQHTQVLAELDAQLEHEIMCSRHGVRPGTTEASKLLPVGIAGMRSSQCETVLVFRVG